MTTPRLVLGTLVVACSLGPSTAVAQENWGMSISGGAGIEDFVDADMRATTGVAGTWGVRYQVGTRTPIGFEAAYLGTAQSIDAIGLDADAILLGNGVEAVLRINLIPDAAVQPYAFMGAAWRRYDLANIGTNTSSVAPGDDVFELPTGAGVAYRRGGLVADLRLGFRIATEQDLMPERQGEFIPLHRWSAFAAIGREF